MKENIKTSTVKSAIPKTSNNRGQEAAMTKNMKKAKKTVTAKGEDRLSAIPPTDTGETETGADEQCRIIRFDGVSATPVVITEADFESTLRAAQAGDVNAQAYCANNYRYGLGTTRDIHRAIYWYEQAVAQGYTMSMYDLAHIYKGRSGVPADLPRRIEMLTMAANAGDAFSQTELGALYSNGHEIDPDGEEAIRWYTMAADQGNLAGLFGIMMMYQKGLGVPQDPAKVQEYRAAADKMIKELDEAEASKPYVLPCDLDPAMESAVSDEGAHGVDSLPPCSFPVAAPALERWCRLAAEQGDLDAQYAIGVLYLFRMLSGGKSAEAIPWFRRAAVKGHGPSLYVLGVCHFCGICVPKDSGLALRFYAAAANRDFVPAMEELRDSHFHGTGTPVNRISAGYWHDLAQDTMADKSKEIFLMEVHSADKSESEG